MKPENRYTFNVSMEVLKELLQIPEDVFIAGIEIHNRSGTVELNLVTDRLLDTRKRKEGDPATPLDWVIK